MLKELENNFSELEKKISGINKKYRNMSTQYAELSSEYEDLKKKYEEEKKKNQVLAEEYKSIKLHAAISGNPDHNRMMKNYINRLIKEVDSCIAEINNSGL